MTQPLDKPPIGATFDWRTFKTWFYKLWVWVTQTLPGNLTYGGDSYTYSSAIRGLGAPGDAGQFSLIPSLQLLPAKLIAYNTSAQSVPNNSSTTVTNWTTSFSQGISFNATTGLATVLQPGLYLIVGGLEFTSAVWSAGQTTEATIYQNSTPIAQSQCRIQANVTTFIITGNAVGIALCAAGDTLSLQAYQSQGGAVALDNSLNFHNAFFITQVQ